MERDVPQELGIVRTAPGPLDVNTADHQRQQEGHSQFSRNPLGTLSLRQRGRPEQILPRMAVESIIQSNACHEPMPCQENNNDNQHWLTECRQRATMYAASCIVHHTKHKGMTST